MGKMVYLHVGGHRTGTSSFQMCLDLNRARLAAAGIDSAYPGRDGIPGGRLRLKLPGPEAGARKQEAMVPAVRAELERHITDPTRALVLSEENIPGRMFHFYKGRFFPAAEARLRVLRAGLGQIGCAKPTRVVLVLRSYDALFASAYRKRAEDNPVPSFREIAPRMVAMDRGWPALVRAIKSLLVPDELVVIEYGVRGASRELLKQLLPDLDGTLAEPDRALNLSATDRALEALQTRYHAGAKLSRADWQAVIADHSDARESTGFAAFTPEERDALRARYAEHLEKIARIRGITFLR